MSKIARISEFHQVVTNDNPYQVKYGRAGGRSSPVMRRRGDGSCGERRGGLAAAGGAADGTPRRRRGKEKGRRKSSPLEHFQFETRCVSNHTACRFAEKTLFFRLVWAGRRCRPPRVLPFSKLKRSCASRIQQIRGSCAPSSMPSRRCPPMRVRRTTCPARSAPTVPMRAASRP